MDGATLGSQEIIVRFHEPRGPALPKKAREAELGTGTGEANFQRDDASPVTVRPGSPFICTILV